MKLHRHILISLCENYAGSGDRSGIVRQVTVDVNGEMAIHFEAKDIYGVKVFTNWRIIEIHNGVFKFAVNQDWLGNKMWNGYHFPPEYALGLINAMLRSREWDIIECWTSLTNKIEAGETITGNDLDLDEDYQPLSVNINQQTLSFIKQNKT